MQTNLTVWIRTVAVALLLAMMYYFAGYRIVYSLVMHDAKHEAAFAMKSEGSLTNITLSAKEYAGIKWTEKGKEFSYNGSLYDLVSSQKNGNLVVLHVYCDRNETRWAKAMNDFVKYLFPSPAAKQIPAEGFLSAFQKEYTPMQKANVVYYPSTSEIVFNTDVNNQPSALLLKPIWHPPSIS